MSRRRSELSGLLPFETAGTVRRGGHDHPDTFARITDSLMRSEAFQSLSDRQKVLYIAMRQQFMGRRKPARDFDEGSPEWEKVKGDDCFYYPLHTAKEYSPQLRSGNHARLYNDIRVLIEHGLIECVSSGKATRENSVYRFSSKWRTWRQPSGP